MADDNELTRKINKLKFTQEAHREVLHEIHERIINLEKGYKKDISQQIKNAPPISESVSVRIHTKGSIMADEKFKKIEKDKIAGIIFCCRDENVSGGIIDRPLNAEDLNRLADCWNACRGLARPEMMPELLNRIKYLGKIRSGVSQQLINDTMAEILKIAKQITGAE